MHGILFHAYKDAGQHGYIPAIEHEGPSAVQESKIGNKEKMQVLRRLSSFV